MNDELTVVAQSVDERVTNVLDDLRDVKIIHDAGRRLDKLVVRCVRPKSTETKAKRGLSQTSSDLIRQHNSAAKRLKNNPASSEDCGLDIIVYGDSNHSNWAGI